jgi:hypothetical protein
LQLSPNRPRLQPLPDVAVPRQDGSALARAAAQVAEETFQDLYPQVASLKAAKEAKAAAALRRSNQSEAVRAAVRLS